MTSQSATETSTVTTPSDREIHVERIFHASIDRVWAAYTEPELIAQWWGRGNPLEVIRWEFERGGHWRLEEHYDGGVAGFEGRFREVTPKKRIVRSFEWDGMPAHVIIDTMELVDLGDGRTRVVVDNIFHTTQERDGMLASDMEQGMNASFRALDELLAKSG
ncbi:uncharacterized protein YndB with AHSA1/START domain [Jatrophihabitans sp. GAS493]|uniref:SRPBCC domain-containing protein n=1 Tax=Jatrophihabitans sp. GAS493 TaxID=1907575 RepID=UPI000BB7A5A6|nr:SRPBCC domain-containing protein [Jatrophihabitans sp. GAS493]SOD75091.1 uncharacterized protein YndB with AHSA1/START domain [Jatrophihabitans sp. GAS493]